VRCTSCGHIWHQDPVTVQPPSTSGPLAALSATADLAGNEETPQEEPIRLFAAGLRRPVAPPPAKPSRGLSLLKLAGPTLGLVAVLVLARGPLTERWPPSARLYALMGFPLPGAAPGIAIRGLHTEEQGVGERRQLIVLGEVANLADQAQLLPPLHATVAQGERVLARWSFDTGIAELAPGQSVPFRTELDSAPEGAQSVVVGLGR
jgi:hypothetical protein